MGWAVQRQYGLTVRSVEPVTADEIVWMGLAVGPVKVRIPLPGGRGVRRARRKGFSYGTLRGHPEKGEEAFTVESGQDDDSVVLHVVRVLQAGRLAGPHRRPTRPSGAALDDRPLPQGLGLGLIAGVDMPTDVS